MIQGLVLLEQGRPFLEKWNTCLQILNKLRDDVLRY